MRRLSKENKATTCDNLFHPARCAPPPAVSFGAPVFVCSQSPGEEVDLAGLDTKPLGFPRSTKRPGDLLSISSSPAHYFSSYLPLVFPPPGPFLPSSLPPPSRPAVSILGGVIDFGKRPTSSPSPAAFPSFWLIVFFFVAKKNSHSCTLTSTHPPLSLLHLPPQRDRAVPDQDRMRPCRLHGCIQNNKVMEINRTGTLESL